MSLSSAGTFSQNMSSKSNSQFLGASFSEFINIWGLGGDASLNLTTSRGVTKVAFNCTLGHPGAPHSFSPPSAPSSSSNSPSVRPRHRGPAEREKNRLRAARHQAAKAGTTIPVVVSSETVSATTQVMSSSPSSAPEALTVLDASVSTAPEAEEESSLQFKCDQCDYMNISEKGLRQHIRMKHRISQLDGVDDACLNNDVSVQTDDSLSLVIIGEVGEDCEEHYVGETFWYLPDGCYFDHWHTASIRRAPKDCWVNKSGVFRNRKTGESCGRVT